MAYTNSPLVTDILPHNYNKRIKPITMITIHHNAGKNPKYGNASKPRTKQETTNYSILKGEII